MSRKSRRKPDTRRSPLPAGPQFNLFSVVTMCALGLYLARFFMAAESAHLGDTLLIVLLWLLLATFVCFRKWRFGEPFTFDWRDAAVWLLVLGHVLGGLIVICTDGQKRAAANMLWEWVGVGVAFSMLKETTGQPDGWRRLLTGLVIILIVLSGFGLWQHYVWYPEQRALLLEFDQEAPGSARHTELAQRLGPLANMGDPVAAHVLRDRLLGSSEPIGRFALANTLGGLLAAVLVLLCGTLPNAIRQEHSLWQTGCVVVAMLVVGYCLLLTKSRTAWVGCLLGTAVWGGLVFGRRLLQRRTAVIAGSLLAIVVLLAGVITAIGGLDRQVVTEAPKALKYRLEYWTGTCGVIGEQPLVGIGPGNFRQHYFRYKLPESSEEIYDPHNLFLDALVNGGLIGLAGLLAVLYLAIRGVARTTVDTADRAPVTLFDGTLAAALLGACALVQLPGVFLGVDWQLVILAVAALGVGLASRWLDIKLRFGIAATSAAGAALVVHLLGQGGIAMPVVCLTLLLLLLPAPAGNSCSISMLSHEHVGRLATATALIATCACAWTAIRPVARTRFAMNIGHYEAAAGNLREAEVQFQWAAESDPLDPEPWQALAELRFRGWQQGRSPDEVIFQQAMDYLQEAMDRDPHHPKRYWTAGQWEAVRFERTGNEQAGEESVSWLKRAADGYPGSSRIRADYALALAATGQSQLAHDAAKRALELDELNNRLGHYDKVLEEEVRASLQSIPGPP